MENDNITRFPKSKSQFIKNRRGDMAVSCAVSGRYLKFGGVGHAGAEVGDAIHVEVMTDTDCDLPDRKLCELILPISELRSVLGKLTEEGFRGLIARHVRRPRLAH